MRNKENSRKFTFFVLALIPMFQPKLFTQYTIITIIYILLNLSELAYFVMTFYKKEKKISKPLIYWVIYMIYALMIMLINRKYAGLLQWGYLLIMVTNLMFVFELSKKDNETEILHAISSIGIVLLSINFATLLIFKRGIIRSSFFENPDGDIYFLGIKTQFTTMIFPTITAAVVYYLEEKNKKSKRILFFAILVSLANILYKKISTGIIGIIIVITLVLLNKLLKVKINFRFCIIIAILLQISVVFFNIQLYFEDFIINVLHKDASLSSRTYIWQNAKKILKDESIFRLFFGNGTALQNAFVPYAGGYWQPHNQLLMWIYNYGLIGTFFILKFFEKLSIKNQSSNFKYQFIIIICFTELILSITELYFEIAVCYVPFIMMYYCSNNEKDMIEKTKAINEVKI